MGFQVAWTMSVPLGVNARGGVIMASSLLAWMKIKVALSLRTLEYGSSIVFIARAKIEGVVGSLSFDHWCSANRKRKGGQIVSRDVDSFAKHEMKASWLSVKYLVISSMSQRNLESLSSYVMS
jgi:hypothetical protein